MAAIGAAHRASGAPNPRKPWPDPLPERLTLDDLADLRPADSSSSPDDLSVALADDPGFLAGLNVFAGKVTYAPVAEAVGVDAFDPHAAVVA